MLYLDNSATTQILPEVLDEMLPYLKEEYGNPASKYYSLAVNAKKAVDHARIQVANLLGCEPDEVIFTSGATESNNMIIKGIADCYQDKGNHIVTTKAEHSSVLETCKYLETKGYKVTYLDVDKYGRIDINQLEKILTEDRPILVSVIWGNNELGSLNDIQSIGELCDKHDVYFHTDATQVVGKVHIDLNKLQGINFLSCSAHKVHGPKGIGAAIIRKDRHGLKTKITPLLHGGEQEHSYRSGTLAVHNIVGFGKASEIANEHLSANIEQLSRLEETLKTILDEKFSGMITYNNDSKMKIPGLLNVQFKGLNNEILLRKLSPYIAASTGSACSFSKPSHVLKSVGLSLEEIQRSIRFSLSPFINIEELNILIGL